MKAIHAGQINNRRIKALRRLEEQEHLGTKPVFKQEDETVTLMSEPLTEADLKRIAKEKETLKSRITSEQEALSHKPKKYRGAAR